jgi:hypothetical protein
VLLAFIEYGSVNLDTRKWKSEILKDEKNADAVQL